MADTVLESFLIKLGYQVDQSSQKNFLSAISGALGMVGKFVGELVALSIAVEEMVRRTAAQMARLHFTAELANSSSLAMKRYAEAVQSVGGSYEQAIQSQEKFGQFLLQQPWMKGYAAAAIGREFANTSDFMEAATQKYHQLSQQFGEDSKEVQAYRIELEQVLGIDMKPLILADKDWEGHTKAIEQANRATEAFGSRWNETEVQAVRLTRSFGFLTDTADRYYKTSMKGLMEFLTTIFDAVNNWLLSQAPKFESWMDELEQNFREGNWEKLGEQIGDLILNAITKSIDYIGQHLEGWVEAGLKAGEAFANGFENSLLKVLPTWMSDAIAKIEGRPGSEKIEWGKILHDFIGLPPEMDKWLRNLNNEPGFQPGPHYNGEPNLTPGKPPGSYQHGGIVPINAHPGEMVLPKVISDGLQSFYGGGEENTWMDDVSRWLEGDTAFEPMVNFVDEVYTKLTDVFEDALLRVGGGAGAGGGGAGGGDKPSTGDGDKPSGDKPSDGDSTKAVPSLSGGSKQQQAMDYFIKAGWTKEQAAGIVANLSVETGGTFDPKSKGDSGQAYGVGQWHPDRQAKFKEIFGKDIKESTYAEQLAYVNWELRNGGPLERKAGEELKKQLTAETSGATVSRRYERPAAADYNARLRGQKAAEIARTYQPGDTATLPDQQQLPKDSFGGGGGGAVGNVVDQMIALSGGRGAAVREFLRNPKGVIERDPDLGLWCAEFTNAYLQHSGVPHPPGLFARSYAAWGYAVAAKNLRKGDVLLNLNRAHVGVATGKTWLNTPGHKPGEVEEISSNTLGPHGELLNIPGTRWRSDVEVRRSAELAKLQEQTNQVEVAQKAQELKKNQDQAAQRDIQYSSGLKPVAANDQSRPITDNSTNITHIHGVTNYHDAIPGQVTGDRRDAYQKRYQRTYYA
jgi:hypothetical protein